MYKTFRSLRCWLSGPEKKIQKYIMLWLENHGHCHLFGTFIQKQNNLAEQRQITGSSVQ